MRSVNWNICLLTLLSDAMGRRQSILWLLILCCTLLVPLAPRAEFRELPTITVLAPRELALPMAHMVREFTRVYQVSVIMVYGDTPRQFEDIREGEAADVFITDDAEVMQQLKNTGLIDVYALARLMQNPLWLVQSTSDASPDALPESGACVSARDPLAQHQAGHTESLPWLSGDSAGSERDNTLVTRALQFSARESTKRLVRRHGPFRQWLLCRPFVTISEAYIGGRIMRRISQSLQLPAPSSGAGITIEKTYSAVSQALAAQPRSVGVLPESWLASGQAGHALRPIMAFPASLYDVPVYHALVIAGENMQPARLFLEYLKKESVQTILRQHLSSPIAPQ